MIKEVRLVSCCTTETFTNEVNRWLTKGFIPRGNLIVNGNSYSLLMVRTEGILDRWESFDPRPGSQITKDFKKHINGDKGV